MLFAHRSQMFQNKEQPLKTWCILKVPWLSFKRPSTVFQDTEFENLKLNLFCYLCTIIVVLWYCRRIEWRVQCSVVVIGSVQTPVLSFRPIGARNELGERSKCIDCLVDPVVSLMTQHHLEFER